MNIEDKKIIVVSGPVIIENDKVLLNRHGKTDKEKKKWKFIGGKILESDLNHDSLETACKREVKEEMGIKVEIISSLKPIMIMEL